MPDLRIANWLVAIAVMSGCADSVHSKSSETHFLGLCEPGDCAEGNVCVCGVCTVACESNATCDGLADAAECLPIGASGCATPAICDVSCDDDGDCTEIEGEHRCQAGRCRAAGVGTTALPPGGCAFEGTILTDGEAFTDMGNCRTCSCNDGGVECRPNCSFDGVELRDCDYNGMTYRDGQRFPADDGCNQCMCNDGTVDCSPGTCKPPIDTPPCEAGSCEFYGICYPEGATTEDGCCTCGDGCIEPGWCPGRPDIGSRCGEQSMGCAMGLECRNDFVGERPICSRGCNYGCPTGTECVDEVPAHDGTVIYGVCLRTCTTQADCEFPEGTGTASECDTLPGLERSYCF